MKPLELKLIPCDHCGGIGTVPGPKTGHVLRRERESRGVTRQDLLKHFAYKSTYTFDLENDARPWSNELVTKYRTAIEAAVQERLAEETVNASQT